METILTLKSSSVLFLTSVNLLKNTPVKVDVEKLVASDIKLLNSFIKSGAVLSSEGELPTSEVVAEVEDVVVEVVLEPQPVAATEEVLVEEVVDVEAKPATVEEQVEVKVTKPRGKTAKKKTT